MSATQFSGGGSLANGIASRASKSNQTPEKFKSISSFCRGEYGKFVTFNRQKNLGHVDVVGASNLTARHRQLFKPLVTHRRKNRFPVVAKQWSSDSGVSSSEVEERLVLQEENSLNGGVNGAP